MIRKFFALLLALLLATALGAAAAEDFPSNIPLYRADELFSKRDLRPYADMEGAAALSLHDGEDIRITEGGVYVLSGSAVGATVYVEADKEAKVQLVLNGISVENSDFPCIYVVSADKVFITTLADSRLAVTGAFRKDGDENTDSVIYARDDLVLNGSSVLTVSSTDKGISGKDDLKITGGTYIVDAVTKAFQAHDSIRISGGVFRITAGTDGFHAENKKKDDRGYIYICGGDITVQAGDDAIRALSVIQIDGGSLALTAAEGLEGTWIQINSASLSIRASDDCINASAKSSAYDPTVIFNGGETVLETTSEKADAVDANGDVYINGGTLTVTGDKAFDFTGACSFTGGTVSINGETVTEIPNSH